MLSKCKEMIAPMSDKAGPPGDDLPLQEFVSHLTASQGRIRAFVVSLMPGSSEVGDVVQHKICQAFIFWRQAKDV
jgi:hypothetical protein